MSRSSTASTSTENTEETSTVTETSTAEISTTSAETTTTTTTSTDDSSSVSSTKYYLPETTKIGIVRYLQLHPTGNATVDRALKMIYKNTRHTEKEWEIIVAEFI